MTSRRRFLTTAFQASALAATSSTLQAQSALAPKRTLRKAIMGGTLGIKGSLIEKYSAAKAAGYELKVGRFPFLANGKAIALGEDQGLIKTIFDAKTGRLLGAHMVGAEVTELIQGFVIAMGLETTEEELMHTVFPHPTLSETMHESVLDAYGRVIHM